MKALERACKIVGGQNALARTIGVKQGHIWYWLKSRVPAERVESIVDATGGTVTKEQLRPDIFKPERVQK